MPETLLLDQIVEALRQRFPADWSIVLREGDRRYAKRPDALLDIQAPDGASSIVAIEVKQAVRPRDVDRTVAQLKAYQADMSLVVAPYLSDRTQELLERTGTGYADTTGNIRLVLSRPAAFVRTAGATLDPWRTERTTKSLRGPVAGRLVRALCDFRPPYGVRALATRADLYPGTISKLLGLLGDEALVRRGAAGHIDDVDWSALIRRWTKDYSFVESNTVRRFIEPRGLPEIERKLRAAELRYAVTGSIGTRRAAPIAPARLASIYVESLASATAELGLTPTETGANVLLAEPFDPVVFDRTSNDASGLTLAAPSQVVADLMTGPGREPNEAEAMMVWMRESESEWRS